MLEQKWDRAVNAKTEYVRDSIFCQHPNRWTKEDCSVPVSATRWFYVILI